MAEIQAGMVTAKNITQVAFFGEPEAATPVIQEAIDGLLFKPAGLIQEDGFKFSPNMEEGESLNVWPNTEHGQSDSTMSPEVSFGFVQTFDTNILELAYNALDISGTAESFQVHETGLPPANKKLVFEFKVGDNGRVRRMERRIVLNAKFTSREDEEFDGEANYQAISVTYKALPVMMEVNGEERPVYTIIQRWSEDYSGE